MSRSQRHSKILEIIASMDIETQEEIVSELVRSGFSATQATVSRDIKELGLIKILSDKGFYKYAAIKGADNKVSNKLVNIFKDAVNSVTSAENIVIVKTLSGSANAVLSVINQLNFPESLGNVACDDTILMVCPDSSKAENLKQKIKNLFE
ncbi:MAG TPA: arginine repressor [Clostridia bacterium]|nr:arginine repressor [Clostridia bacterium]